MLFPEDPGPFLVQRARVFWDKNMLDKPVLDEIITLLVADRIEAEKEGLAIPGAAEFLDLARALAKRHPGDAKKQSECLKEIARFALKKNLLPKR